MPLCSACWPFIRRIHRDVIVYAYFVGKLDEIVSCRFCVFVGYATAAHDEPYIQQQHHRTNNIPKTMR